MTELSGVVTPEMSRLRGVSSVVSRRNESPENCGVSRLKLWRLRVRLTKVTSHVVRNQGQAIAPDVANDPLEHEDQSQVALSFLSNRHA